VQDNKAGLQSARAQFAERSDSTTLRDGSADGELKLEGQAARRPWSSDLGNHSRLRQML
jgi:hypothetical protein